MFSLNGAFYIIYKALGLILGNNGLLEPGVYIKSLSFSRVFSAVVKISLASSINDGLSTSLNLSITLSISHT
jgi:hypothetical protein